MERTPVSQQTLIPTYTIDLDAAAIHTDPGPTATTPGGKWSDDLIKRVAEQIAHQIAEHQGRPKLDDLRPYIEVFAYLMIATSIAQQAFLRPRMHKACYLMWGICYSLVYNGGLLRALSAALLLVAQVVYTQIPGSFGASKLPSYKAFVRTLTSRTQFADDEEHSCMICWDDEKPLLDLPCKHKVCDGCLKIMGDTQQTSCPLCSRPLYRGNERIMLFLQKGRIALNAVNIVLALVIVIYRVRRGELWKAAGTLASSVAGSAVPIMSSVWHIRADSERWWKGENIGLPLMWFGLTQMNTVGTFTNLHKLE